MQISLSDGLRAASMMVLATTLGCAEDEKTTDAGVGGNGGAGGALGGATGGGGPSGGAGGSPIGGAGGGGGSVDAALPDAALITCPPELAAEVVDLNLHPDGEGFRYAGDTTAASNHTSNPCGGEEAPDVLHRFVAPRAGAWRVDTESTDPKWDTLLSARSTCLDTGDTNCNDDAAYPPLSQLNLELAAGEEVYVVVDGHTGGAAPDRGAYTLLVTPN